VGIKVKLVLNPTYDNNNIMGGRPIGLQKRYRGIAGPPAEGNSEVYRRKPYLYT